MSSQQCCECFEWNACCFTALDRKRANSTPCPETIDAIPATPADRFPFSASPRNSIVRLCPGRWRWRRGWWWGRRSRRRSRRGRRRCCEYGRGQRRRGGHRRGCGGKCGKRRPQRNSPAGPDGSRNARWRRPGRLKFRRSVERKHGGRSGRDRGAGAAHHQRSKRWWWAKCRTGSCQPLTQCCSRGFWVRCRTHSVSSSFAQAFHPSQLF
jgi:hypothetical protein